jgi:hypothetical protein
MDESFGARMRRQRECLGIPLTTIAEQTKIKLVLLEALERDDVTRWPSGIFRRSFIRSYARAIRLDPDALVREFLALYPDPIEHIEQLPAAADVDYPSPSLFQHLVEVARDSLSSFRLGGPDRRRPAIGDIEDCSPPSAIVTHVGHQRTERKPAIPAAGEAGQPLPEAHKPGLLSQANGADPARHRPIDGFNTAATALGEDPLQRASGASAEPGRAAFGALSAADANAPLASSESSAPAMDLAPLAQLCTALGQAIDLYDAAAVLEQTAGVLDSIGLIVWAWDPATAELTAALAHGYSNRILAQLPRVRPEDENATAAAFRSGEISVVAGEGQAIGALAVPLLAPSGRVGVLACELKKEQVRSESVRALAAILAAQLARLVEALQTAEAADRMLA